MVVNEKIAGNEISGAFKVDMTSASPSAVYLAPFDGSKADSQYEITVATGKKEGVFFMNGILAMTYSHIANATLPSA